MADAVMADVVRARTRGGCACGAGRGRSGGCRGHADRR
jgi:hypothetical protein